MSQIPPSGPVVPAAPFPGPKRANGMAIAGLICAIAGFCLWFVGGLVGIILGLIGLGKSRDPQVGGRGIAIAAILVGSLSFIASGGFSYLVYRGIRAGVSATQPARDAARAFVQDLSNDDVNAAAEKCAPNLTAADLQPFAHKLHALGGFMDMTSSQINMEDTGGAVTCSLNGVATFNSGKQDYDLTLVRTGTATWKVSKAQFP